MPKPENFDKLTPDQKRQARLEAWINHEGLEFTNPEAEKGYRERAQMFADVFSMKKPKRVPVAICNGILSLPVCRVLAAKTPCTTTKSSARQ